MGTDLLKLLMKRLQVHVCIKHDLTVVTQVSASVPGEQKILKPSDYPRVVDHHEGDWKTIVRKSKSLIPGF